MQRLLLVLLITTGAISLSGCGFFNRNSDVTEDPTAPTDQGNTPVVKIPDPKLPGLPEGEESGNLVEVSANSPTVVARDLIQSTDPNERTIGVERTRSDPFAGLTIPLIPPQPIEVPGSEATGGANNRGVAASSNFSPGSTAARAAAAGSTTAAAGRGASSAQLTRPTVAGQRQVDSRFPEIAALPEIPQPTIARAVRVSGVINIGGSPYAIVQAPDEVERYVRQGERIAGGSVIVKRIDTSALEPRVILVENGIEVERFVTPAADAVEDVPASTPSDALSTISGLPELPTPGI
ncbi:hypothetical protein [Leptothoe sp. PORK10 BA2]|uniref:hypothetical protein n=1 Tax=Leptothoe sp. PORK10 BA2 TaxID=3110254 RepID=UPI002B215923|nr:hypothetical protein [Leptothoe sp. PORK10 BA2]MEA5463450.1 hypothetical protein [Leptothoe sp. PORK10 BA2]